MISKQEVQHIAKLARLGLNETEIKRFQKDLSSILDYFNSLKEIDISNVKTTFHPAEYFLKEKLGVTREDEAKSQPVEKTNKLIEATPEKKDDYIKVREVF